MIKFLDTWIGRKNECKNYVSTAEFNGFKNGISMKKGIVFLFLVSFLFIGAQCMEQPDKEILPLLVRKTTSYTSLPMRTDTPPADIERGQKQDFKRRKATLCTAISAKDIALAKSCFEKELEWVNTLYLRQTYNNNQINKGAHEKLREKLQFTQQLFAEIDCAIAKEEARLELLRKFSMPGQLAAVCSDYDQQEDLNTQKYVCSNSWPQWSNISLSILALGLAAIYCKAAYPSRLPTSDPCAILPPDQQAQMFLDCQQSSLKTKVPCEIFDPRNATQIRLMEDCCENLVNLFCLAQVDQYNDHVYPQQVWHAWRPGAVILPAIVALQFAFQAGGYLYRRSKRLREPIKQLLAQKKNDLIKVEQDLNTCAIIDDSTFQEL